MTRGEVAIWDAKEAGRNEPFVTLLRSGYIPSPKEWNAFAALAINAGDPARQARKDMVIKTYRIRRREVGRTESAEESKTWTAVRCGEDVELVCDWVRRAPREVYPESDSG